MRYTYTSPQRWKAHRMAHQSRINAMRRSPWHQPAGDNPIDINDPTDRETEAADALEDWRKSSEPYRAIERERAKP